MARNLNKAQLIGNLTGSPELRQTPQGTSVCNFTVATNRSWKDASGQIKEEATFHKIIAWNKLAEICAQLLYKGRKVFVEGRLSNREWEDKEGNRHSITEVIASDLIVLDKKMYKDTEPEAKDIVGEEPSPPEPEPKTDKSK